MSVYFDRPGPENTEAVMKLAFARAKELGIATLVCATTTGATARAALAHCPGMRIVAVSYHAGFKEPFKRTLSDEAIRELERLGVRAVCATHALSGVERGLAKKLSGPYPVMIMAETLRLFGQGTKVAVEVAIMATDAGALSGEPIIAVGGTGKGADTALVLTPACQSDALDLRIHEIIAKPNLYAAAK